jgi:hypothetical protein
VRVEPNEWRSRIGRQLGRQALACWPDRQERAVQVQASDSYRAQSAAGKLRRDSQGAEHGGTGTGRDRGLDVGGGGQLSLRRHALEACLVAQRLLDEAPCARAGLPAHQRGGG